MTTDDEEPMDARSVDVGKCLSRAERGFAAVIVLANLSLVGWLAAGAEFGGLMDGPSGDPPAAGVVAEDLGAPDSRALSVNDAARGEALARAFADPQR